MCSFYLETVVFLPLSETVVNVFKIFAQPIVKIAAFEKRYYVKTKVNPNIFCAK